MGQTRQFLRTATAEAHRRLDENPMVAALAAGDIQLKSYLRMLSGYQSFFSHWEPLLHRNHPQIIEILGEFRFEKSIWLTEDLRTLNCLRTEFPTDDIMMPDDLPGLAGCLYVIEGSTLGGMHLSKSSAGFPGNAGRFFQGYGQQTLSSWAAFLAWLELAATSDSDRERASETANETFRWFERKFAATVAIS